MNKKQFLITYRIFFALLVLAAITTQLHHSLQLANFSLVNFFSYFTIQSNFFAAAILLMTAYLLANNKKRDHEQEMLRGAATLYMVTTGIIYGLLLSKAKVQITLPWVNDVLHRLFPLVLLFDWLYDRPTCKITPRQSLLWLVYPVMYLAYTLVRGPSAHWYPYPFLDVSQKGYASVFVASICIAIVVYALSQILLRLPAWIKPAKR